MEIAEIKETTEETTEAAAEQPTEPPTEPLNYLFWFHETSHEFVFLRFLVVIMCSGVQGLREGLRATIAKVEHA